MGQRMMWGHDPQDILGINGWAWGPTMAPGLLYATGEVSHEEYEQMLKALERSSCNDGD